MQAALPKQELLMMTFVQGNGPSVLLSRQDPLWDRKGRSPVTATAWPVVAG